MTRRTKTPTAACRRCSRWSGDGCTCDDHKRCSDCNMPRCVLISNGRAGA